MKCDLCKGEIEVKRDSEGKVYWDEGNDAWPLLKEGRCCDNCNDFYVIPARLRGVNC